MKINIKSVLEFLAVFLITVVIAISSPFNPWQEGTFTEVQSAILDTAHGVREGFLAYLELDGHYGPVLYEFYGLGYLPTDTHILHFIMEFILVFVAVLFLYKTAKLYTSEIFAIICAGIISIFGWGELTHAGAEEALFIIMTLTAYHVTRQLKYGFLSYHAYLLAIDFGLVLFLQPGYSILWVIIFILLGIKFKSDGLYGDEYYAYFTSLGEGILTIIIPMGLYLWYFNNAGAFLQQVIVYNFTRLGSLGEGLRVLFLTPWIVIAAAFILVIVYKNHMKEHITDLYYWLVLMVFAFIVMALQGGNFTTIVQMSKALYIVPLASAFSILDKRLGWGIEERQF